MVVAFMITLIILNICRRANPYKADNWFAGCSWFPPAC
jgi:PiT family inorganic phosphate transporter